MSTAIRGNFHVNRASFWQPLVRVVETGRFDLEAQRVGSTGMWYSRERDTGVWFQPSGTPASRSAALHLNATVREWARRDASAPRSRTQSRKFGQDNRKVHIRPEGAPSLPGTCFCTNSGRWAAKAQVKYKNVHIGVFDTAEEAHAAYVAYRKGVQQ